MTRLVLRFTPFLLASLLIVVMVSVVPALRQLGYWQTLPPPFFAPAALALALTPIILTGGIDLSVGAVAVLSSVVVGILYRDVGLPIGLAVAGGLATGLVCGCLNGLLVAAGVLPLVATLATRELFVGLAVALIGDQPVTGFPDSLRGWWVDPRLRLLVNGGLLAMLWGASYLVVHHTSLGRMLFAIGDNERATRFAALPVTWVKVGLYSWAGLVGGICGVLLVIRYNTAKADAERSLELVAIACVVMGGVRVTGGAGHLVGVLVGIVTVCVLRAGMTLVAADWRDTTTGAVLVVVALASEASARWIARLDAEQPRGIIQGRTR